jgi:hypothetical protein
LPDREPDVFTSNICFSRSFGPKERRKKIEGSSITWIFRRIHSEKIVLEKIPPGKGFEFESEITDVLNPTDFELKYHEILSRFEQAKTDGEIKKSSEERTGCYEEKDRDLHRRTDSQTRRRSSLLTGPFCTLKAAFDMGFGFKDAIELHDRGADDEKAANALFRSPWKTYKIQIHNIGKDWHRRYYAHHGNFSWLQLEHFLITHCWHFRIDETRITNKKIAESMGWLDPEDKDQRRIELAERKVINNLIKIRDERKTISIEQRHNYGKMGSFHVIRMNWEIIIPFYQMTDDNQPMTIRTRKGIRYRVISLISKVVKAFTRAFQDLLDKQRKKYLLGLVTLDQDEFKNAKDLWRSFLEAIDGPTGLLAPGKTSFRNTTTRSDPDRQDLRLDRLITSI